MRESLRYLGPLPVSVALSIPIGAYALLNLELPWMIVTLTACALAILLAWAFSSERSATRFHSTLKALTDSPEFVQNNENLTVQAASLIPSDYSFLHNGQMVATLRVPSVFLSEPSAVTVDADHYTISTDSGTLVMSGSRGRVGDATYRVLVDPSATINCRLGVLTLVPLRYLHFAFEVRRGRELVGFVLPERISLPSGADHPTCIFAFAVAVRLLQEQASRQGS